MGVLKAFLNPLPLDETKDIVISQRFVDDNGDPVPFTIKSVSQEVNTALVNKYTRPKMVNGRKVDIFDNNAYTRALVVACTVQPDFREAEMCQAYGCVDPMSVPEKMLRPGEFTNLVKEIMELCGFDDDAQLLSEDAKN